MIVVGNSGEQRAFLFPIWFADRPADSGVPPPPPEKKNPKKSTTTKRRNSKPLRLAAQSALHSLKQIVAAEAAEIKQNQIMLKNSSSSGLGSLSSINSIVYMITAPTVHNCIELPA
jgi:hypothetical protein